MFKYLLVLPFLLFTFFVLQLFGVGDAISFSTIGAIIVIYLILVVIIHFIKRKKKT